MKGRQANELYEGILLGSNAVLYMAMQIAQTGRDFEFVTAANAERMGISDEAKRDFAALRDESVKALRDALLRVYRLMNQLGDHLNGMDGVEHKDERATDHAFRRVRRLLRGTKGGM